MRNAKTLGLALLAMLSIGAVTAASASADTLTAGGYPAVLTGAVDERWVHPSRETQIDIADGEYTTSFAQLQ
jgi:hypothetical protein